MKAVILAGGLGTRLRPITYHTPKPLVPLLGKPMVMHIIDSLPEEVDTVILAVSYMKDSLEEYFIEHDCGREVILINETEPLGTGGALKNVSHHLTETFFAFNGDVLCSIDLNDMLAKHRANRGIGSISLWDVEDPTAFGVVGMDQENRVHTFQEKPKREEAVSRSINAGVYIFEPVLFSFIGDGVVSLEREVFPKVLDRGLYGYRFGGYWVDCGTRENYLKAQRTLIESEGGKVMACEIKGGTAIAGLNHLEHAVLDGCSVGPNVYAGPGVRIGKGCRVVNSALMANVMLEERCEISDSLIGAGVSLSQNTVLKSKIRD